MYGGEYSQKAVQSSRVEWSGVEVSEWSEVKQSEME